jgi:hypothetical protein
MHINAIIGARLMVLAQAATPALAQNAAAPSATAHPDQRPALLPARARDAAAEARIDALMSRMAMSDKVGQLIQVDIASITPNDLETYKFGSVLNGGNSAPNNDEYAPPAEWLALFDAFYDASMKRSDDRPKFPVIWVNPELNAADAFVAARLPGTEGGGMADVLIAGADGKPAHDFKGKLSFSWPKRLDQFVLNARDANYDPLFPFGYGLTYADGASRLGALDETRPEVAANDRTAVFVRGSTAAGATFDRDGAIRLARTDRGAQEDSLRLTWTGPGGLSVNENGSADFTRESNRQLSLIVDYRVMEGAAGMVTLGMASAERQVDLPLTGAVRTTGDWTTVATPLRCFADGGVNMAAVTCPFIIAATGPMAVDISSIRIASAPPGPVQCGVR